MFKIIILYISFTFSVFSGGQREVTEKEEKEVIAASHTVFEAVFVEQKISFWMDGKEVKKEKVFIKRGNKGVGNIPLEASIRRDITLLVTEPIKGDLKKHQILTIAVYDAMASMCPHYMSYGDYYTKQIYYNNGKSNEHNYRHRTLRDELHFTSVISRNVILGELGERIGKILKIEGQRLKEDKNDSFFTPSPKDYFQTSKLGEKNFSQQLILKLEPKYASSGGKLPEPGKEVIIEGYESIVVHPFSGEKEIDKIKKENPVYYIREILETVFIVTKVTYKK